MSDNGKGWFIRHLGRACVEDVGSRIPAGIDCKLASVVHWEMSITAGYGCQLGPCAVLCNTMLSTLLQAELLDLVAKEKERKEATRQKKQRGKKGGKVADAKEDVENAGSGAPPQQRRRQCQQCSALQQCSRCGSCSSGLCIVDWVIIQVLLQAFEPTHHAGAVVAFQQLLPTYRSMSWKRSSNAHLDTTLLSPACRRARGLPSCS